MLMKYHIKTRDQLMPSSAERFTFPGAMGGDLAAQLDKPDGTPKAYALFAHFLTCTNDIFYCQPHC
jgi:hypothetical protein